MTSPEGSATQANPALGTVLVVDDEAAARELCSDVARAAGLSVRTATTTEQALEVLDQFPVEIVLTDLRVPQLGGLELLKRVRDLFPQIPKTGDTRTATQP